MPEQEPGTRPARPLPYQPDASATVGDGALTGPDGFRRRLMGHIENGRPSVSG